jgi:hypothetical protein
VLIILKTARPAYAGRVWFSDIRARCEDYAAQLFKHFKNHHVFFEKATLYTRIPLIERHFTAFYQGNWCSFGG